MSTLLRVRTAITGGPGGSEVSTQYFNKAAATEQQAADAVHDFWDAMKGGVHTSYRFDVESLVYTIDSATGLATGTAGTTTTQVVGTNAGDPLPGNVNGVMRLHTGAFIDGRELVGKIWLPGPCEPESVAGVPSGAYKTTADNAMASLFIGVPPDLVIFSRKHLTFHSVTSGSTWSQWGSLRSRRS